MFKALLPLIVVLLLTCLIFPVLLACCKRMITSARGAFIVRKSTTDALEQSVIYEEIPFEDGGLGEEVVEESTRGGNDKGKNRTHYTNTHRTEACNFHAKI